MGLEEQRRQEVGRRGETGEKGEKGRQGRKKERMWNCLQRRGGAER